MTLAGLAGNAAIAYKSGGPRSGILLHTGSWDKSGSDTMEDSHGLKGGSRSSLCAKRGTFDLIIN